MNVLSDAISKRILTILTSLLYLYSVIFYQTIFRTVSVYRFKRDEKKGENDLFII